MTVRVGSSDLESGGKIHTIKKIHVHPYYEPFDYDFALLELDEPVFLSNKVQLVKLVEQGVDLDEGTFLNATGWGTTAVRKLMQIVSLYQNKIIFFP